MAAQNAVRAVPASPSSTGSPSCSPTPSPIPTPQRAALPAGSTVLTATVLLPFAPAAAGLTPAQLFPPAYHSLYAGAVASALGLPPSAVQVAGFALRLTSDVVAPAPSTRRAAAAVTPLGFQLTLQFAASAVGAALGLAPAAQRAPHMP